MRYRLYFNRCEDFPQIWSIDEGTVATEVNVIGFEMVGCLARSDRAEDFAALDSVREPKAWLAVDAHELRIVAGVAMLS